MEVEADSGCLDGMHRRLEKDGGARGLRRAQAKVATAVLVAAALLAGCGSKPAAEPPAASFSAAVAAPSAVPAAEGKPADSGAAPSPVAPAASPVAASASPPAPQAGGDSSPSPAPQGMAANAAAEATPAASVPPAPAQQEPKAVAAAQQPAAEPTPTAAPASAVEPAPAAEETPPAAKPTPSSKSASNELKWSEFFDDDKQSTPSNKFWDLNGKTVQIKGFMGEVLSFDKHWFLLIPQPGAECPFDNGDETYWNKIMIVFVPKDTKLRYTTGPLQITGRLDVGIKIDESGYKTMFRLYDAKFEKIKE